MAVSSSTMQIALTIRMLTNQGFKASDIDTCISNAENNLKILKKKKKKAKIKKAVNTLKSIKELSIFKDLFDGFSDAQKSEIPSDLAAFFEQNV